MRKQALHFLTAAAVGFAFSPALAQTPAATPAPKQNSCFFSNQFENWKAPNNKTMYIRVGVNRFYKLEMAGTCSALTGISPHLVTEFRGSNNVCSALDWNLKVVDSPNGIAQPCIVKTMTQMTPKEVAAIPKKFKP